MGNMILTSAGHGTYNLILAQKFWVTKEIFAIFAISSILTNFNSKKWLQKCGNLGL